MAFSLGVAVSILRTHPAPLRGPPLRWMGVGTAHRAPANQYTILILQLQFRGRRLVDDDGGVAVHLHDGGGPARGDRAFAGSMNRVGFACPGRQQQQRFRIHNRADAHGDRQSWHLFGFFEETRIGLAGGAG